MLGTLARGGQSSHSGRQCAKVQHIPRQQRAELLSSERSGDAHGGCRGCRVPAWLFNQAMDWQEDATLHRQEDARGAMRARAAPGTWNTGRSTRACQGGTRHLAHRQKYARVPGRHPAPGTQEEVRARARAARRRQLVRSDYVSRELVGKGDGGGIRRSERRVRRRDNALRGNAC